jgi:hypothetical protein
MKELILNPVAKMIAEQVSGPVSDLRYHSSMGTILAYYPETNTADISVNVRGEEQLKRSVPMLITSPTSSTIYFEKDKVLVLFLFGDSDIPVILGKVDETFAINTMARLKKQYINIP